MRKDLSKAIKDRRREWAKRYVPAEIIGTLCALTFAWTAYHHTHSYVAGAAAGWVGEGVGFFGYFITLELLSTTKQYSYLPLYKRIARALTQASTNLLVEFLPAELIDNFIIRPFAMYIAPQYIHPYALGFLVGKFASDIFFYTFAIIGYELRKRFVKQ